MCVLETTQLLHNYYMTKLLETKTQVNIEQRLDTMYGTYPSPGKAAAAGQKRSQSDPATHHNPSQRPRHDNEEKEELGAMHVKVRARLDVCRCPNERGAQSSFVFYFFYYR
jgi:hypothetical protein